MKRVQQPRTLLVLGLNADMSTAAHPPSRSLSAYKTRTREPEQEREREGLRVYQPATPLSLSRFLARSLYQPAPPLSLYRFLSRSLFVYLCRFPLSAGAC